MSHIWHSSRFKHHFSLNLAPLVPLLWLGNCLHSHSHCQVNIWRWSFIHPHSKSPPTRSYRSFHTRPQTKTRKILENSTWNLEMIMATGSRLEKVLGLSVSKVFGENAWHAAKHKRTACSEDWPGGVSTMLGHQDSPMDQWWKNL